MSKPRTNIDKESFQLERYKNFLDKGFDTKLRTIYLGSEYIEDDGRPSGVEHLLSTRIMQTLDILTSESKDPITLVINNPGGSCVEMFAIYDKIKQVTKEVEVTGIVYGQAMSAATVILQACDHRLISPRCSFMVHYGQSYTYSYNSSMKQSERKYEDWVESEVNKIYLEKIKQKDSKFTLDKIKKMLEYDNYLLPSEVVDIGLADKIIEE